MTTLQYKCHHESFLDNKRKCINPNCCPKNFSKTIDYLVNLKYKRKYSHIIEDIQSEVKLSILSNFSRYDIGKILFSSWCYQQVLYRGIDFLRSSKSGYIWAEYSKVPSLRYVYFTQNEVTDNMLYGTNIEEYDHCFIPQMHKENSSKRKILLLCLENYSNSLCLANRVILYKTRKTRSNGCYSWDDIKNNFGELKVYSSHGNKKSKKINEYASIKLGQTQSKLIADAKKNVNERIKVIESVIGRL